MKDCCYITAFLDINRGEWKHFKRTFNEYLNYFMPYIKLLENCDKTKYEMIVYIDEKHFNKLQNIISSHIPIKLIPISEKWLEKNSILWTRLEKEKQIMEECKEFNYLVNHRKRCPETHNPKYTLINHCKIDIVCHAMELCDAYFYCWTDFGYFNDKSNIPKSMIDINKIEKNKVNYTLINNVQEHDNNIIYTLVNAPEVIGGFFFCGEKEPLLIYQKLYHQIHKQMQDCNIVDDDQHIALQCYFHNRNLFHFHNPRENNNWHKALIYFDSN